MERKRQADDVGDTEPSLTRTCARGAAALIWGWNRVGTCNVTHHLLTGHPSILEAEAELVTTPSSRQQARRSQAPTPTSQQHWEHPGWVQRLPDSYMSPMCQQTEGAGASDVAAGPPGKDGGSRAFSERCEAGIRVPGGEATEVEGMDAGGAGVGDGRRVVLTPEGSPGAPEGGLCPGESGGRPVSSRSNMGGNCSGGCRMAEGASTALGKAGREANGLCRGVGLGETGGSDPLHPRVTAYLRATFIGMTLKHHLLHP